MRIHSKGLNVATLVELMEYSPPPGFEKELFDDLLRKRNRHLLDEVKARLPETENIVVPWGAAHMPEILPLDIGNGEARFPIVWSIIGAALFVAVIGLLTPRRERI